MTPLTPRADPLMHSAPHRCLPRISAAPLPESTHPRYRVGVWSGAGIGPEVIAASLLLLDVIERHTDCRFELRHAPAHGHAASNEHECSEVVAFTQSTFDDGGALLCGPVSGRAIYQMRQALGLYCKLTPIVPMAALRGCGALSPQAVDGVDILMVRENLGGLYQGECRIETRSGQRRASQHFAYDERQVLDIVEAAAGITAQRRGQLTVIFKPGGAPSISELWQSIATAVCSERNIACRFLEVDNAAYQIIANARSFDVVVAPNMFGDVLADTAALLLGSRGLSYSANFTAGGHGVYQTGHGAAHDLKHQDLANPLGQILSLAMMLAESFGLTALADDIRAACNDVLADGWRTRDLAAPLCRVVGTQEFAQRIAEELEVRLQGGKTATLRPVSQAS